jgi:hypothetical protein
MKNNGVQRLTRLAPRQAGQIHRLHSLQDLTEPRLGIPKIAGTAKAVMIGDRVSHKTFNLLFIFSSSYRASTSES